MTIIEAALGSPALPTPRGSITETLIHHLRTGAPFATPSLEGIDPLVDDDLHLALWVCYELHHHGFAEVDDGEEWCPQVIQLRRHLEQAFESALREETDPNLPEDPVIALRVLVRRAGPPLASTIAASPAGRLHEFAIHRSAYQLKEADGHTWGIPRLRGTSRSAMIEIQFDEYGHGEPGAAHSELFAAGLRDLGLDDRFGAYIDRLPGTTLATDNLVEMFGLNRRLRGALVGHLALFEVASTPVMTKYLEAVRRLGGAPAMERFYEVHVEADVHHGKLALDRLVHDLVRDHPHLSADVVFGAAALDRVESRFARRILDRWAAGESSLLP